MLYAAVLRGRRKRRIGVRYSGCVMHSFLAQAREPVEVGAVAAAN